jgi:predicted TIM-barrel enzyme
MARTTATNFSGGLQFPYATAGTDAFKKEDVQTLAQAVDQHDHSTGKGLILPVAAIPPNMAVTMVTVGGDLLIWLMATLRPDTLNAVATVALDIDGSATGPTAQASAGVASQVLCLSVAHRIAAPSAASHTIKARWSISSGSVLAFFTYRSLVVEEIRR